MKKLLITFALSAIFLLGIALIVKHNAETHFSKENMGKVAIERSQLFEE